MISGCSFDDGATPELPSLLGVQQLARTRRQPSCDNWLHELFGGYHAKWIWHEGGQGDVHKLAQHGIALPVIGFDADGSCDVASEIAAPPLVPILVQSQEVRRILRPFGTVENHDEALSALQESIELDEDALRVGTPTRDVAMEWPSTKPVCSPARRIPTNRLGR